MMQKLDVDFEHCYGIKKLGHSFDFQKSKAVAIYAPNGTMKSSFAKTFQDIANKKDTSDNVFPLRETKRIVKVNNEHEIDPSSILIIQPYDEVFSHGARTSTLLINATLRKEYEDLHKATEDAKDKLINKLKETSKTKRDISKEISLTFTKGDNNFFKALTRISDEVATQVDFLPKDVPYDLIFDDKVKALFETDDFRKLLKDYIEQQNELLAKSTYFKKGVFNYYNAGNVAKTLADNGYFNANHGLVLNLDSPISVANAIDLEELITKEKLGITGDPKLRKKFSAIEKALMKNANVRDFEAYLSSHEDILPHLANYDSFKEDVWKIFLLRSHDTYKEVLDQFRACEKRRSEIEALAAKERTDWEDVIEIFNNRFYVPFTLEVKNRVAVLLGTDPVAKLGFTFNEGEETAQIERGNLLQTLSTGEKKALYILNIIFEIRTRKKLGIETLVIVDDVADSFDYRNKYAIIQYLKDVSEDLNFRQIILTHNFDFFRTINGRFVSYGNCFMVSKTAHALKLEKASGVNNIFINDWKNGFFKDDGKRIACIPFMRNLLEYTKGEDDPDFLTLTSLLHIKPDTDEIDHAQLSDIFNRLFGKNKKIANPQEKIVSLITRCATDCLSAGPGLNFENKVVLSIAIRLAAERFMAEKINDEAYLNSISSKQTFHWFEKFRELNPSNAAIKTLDKVLLMTPENIHLNAFMYEPLLDMSDEHLRQLYREVQNLS